MKNVRSGDDKSWCWGEGTGRQGMSFVMSAIWLHPFFPPPPSPPTSPLLPICLLIHISAFSLARRSSTSSSLPLSLSLSPPPLCACVYFLSRFVVMIHLNTFGHLSSSSRALLLPPVCPRRYLNSTPPHIYIGSIVQSSNLKKKINKKHVWLSERGEMTRWDNSAFRINTIRSPPTIILPPPPVHRKTLLRLNKNNLSLALQAETPKNKTHAHWF